MTTTGKTSRGAGRVKFLAHAEKIKELIASGHPQQFVYDQHADVLGISYSQFNRYVSKYVFGKVEGGHQKGMGREVVSPPVTASPARASTDRKNDVNVPKKSSGFQHNATPKEEDLI